MIISNFTFVTAVLYYITDIKVTSMEAGCGHFKCSSHILVRSRKKNGSWKIENTKHEKAKSLFFFSNITYVQFDCSN